MPAHHADSPDPSKLSDDELHDRTLSLAKREQSLATLTLRHLHEVNRRRLHLARGYASIFDHTVKALGFSEPTAAERVQAMRLLDAVPEVAPLIDSGSLTLTTAATVQRFVRREEQETGRRFTPDAKRELLSNVLGQSTRQAQATLLTKSANPEIHAPLYREKERAVTAELTELKLLADAALMSEITRVRELRGAELPLAEIFRAALKTYLQKIDPARKPAATRAPQSNASPSPAPGASDASPATTPPPPTRAPESPAPSRYVRAGDRRAVTHRSQGQCEYQDEKTGRRCPSRTALQLDHRIPYALGGKTTAANLRHLCPSHNRLAAIQAFGRAKMQPFLRY